MKKIISILIISFFFIPNVLAEEFIWSEEKLDNYQKLEEEKRFKFYKEERKGEYIKKGVYDKRYSYEDLEDIKYQEGEYKDTCIVSDNVKVEYKTVYPYKLIPKAKYLIFSNIPRTLNITKLDIYDKEEKISYDIVLCNDCKETTISPGGSMKIMFDEEHIVGNLKINIETDQDNDFAYYAYFNSKDNIFIKNNSLITSKNSFTINDYNYMDNNFKEIYYSDEKVEKDHTKYPLEEKTMCKENTIMTFRYNLVKKYYDDDYHASISDTSYLKDENDYKIYYKYLKEEVKDIVKLEEIKEKNIINEENNYEEIPAKTGYISNQTHKKNTIIPKIIIGVISIAFAITLAVSKTKNKKKMSI